MTNASNNLIYFIVISRSRMSLVAVVTHIKELRKGGKPEEKKSLGEHRYRGRKNSDALVRQRTIPTEQPPLVGEVSANFCG
jgi:hypothetical protein